MVMTGEASAASPLFAPGVATLKAAECTLEAAKNGAIDSALGRMRVDYSIKGSIAAGVSTQAGALFTTAAGFAREGEGADPDATLYRWASMSKTLVGVVAALLAHDGVVDLGADIAALMPGYERPSRYLSCTTGAVPACASLRLPSDAPAITLRMLLAHRAGIQDYFNGASNPGPPKAQTNNPVTNTGMAWALEYFIKQPLIAIPDKQYSYSSFGFNLAAVVLEHVAGMPFADLVHKHVSAPLRMTSLVPDYEWLSGHVLMTKGSCGTHGAWIGSHEACSAAAATLQLEDVSAATVPDTTGNRNNPFGCYFKQSTQELFFNPHGQRDSTDAGRLSVCGRLRYAINTAGTCGAHMAWIESADACESAAAGLQLDDDTAATVPDTAGNRNHPYGCYFKQSTKELFFNPHGNKVDDDTSRVSLCAQRDRRAEGFSTAGGNAGSSDVSWKLGGGGFISTLRDLARYGNALMTDTSWLPDEARSSAEYGLWSPATQSSYSMGFAQTWLNGVCTRLGHSGKQQKSRTIFQLHPVSGYGLYIMSNDHDMDRSDGMSRLQAAFVNLVVPLMPKDPAACAKKTAPATASATTYPASKAASVDTTAARSTSSTTPDAGAPSTVARSTTLDSAGRGSGGAATTTNAAAQGQAPTMLSSGSAAKGTVPTTVPPSDDGAACLAECGCTASEQAGGKRRWRRSTLVSAKDPSAAVCPMVGSPTVESPYWRSPSSFADPVSDTSRISSTFGPRWKFSTKSLDMHRGIDFYGDVGEPVFAMADGVVLKRGWGTSSSGHQIVIEHAIAVPVVFHPEVWGTSVSSGADRAVSRVCACVCSIPFGSVVSRAVAHAHRRRRCFVERALPQKTCAHKCAGQVVCAWSCFFVAWWPESCSVELSC